MGIDGRIFPASALAGKPATWKGETPAFGQILDHWYPIQVKQKDRVGRPDIDSFEAVMTREDRTKGFFIGFDYPGRPCARLRVIRAEGGALSGCT